MFRQIHTGGICYLELLEGSSQWYWGIDCTGGDLYEAEELFTDGHKVDRTRLIFIHHPDGKVVEPIPARKGQYFGRPLFYENKLILLVADFPEKQLLILSYDPETEAVSILATLPRSITEDCYNLQLKLSPLMLVRQGHENTLEILWPVQKTYAMDYGNPSGSAKRTSCILKHGMKTRITGTKSSYGIFIQAMFWGAFPVSS